MKSKRIRYARLVIGNAVLLLVIREVEPFLDRDHETLAAGERAAVVRTYAFPSGPRGHAHGEPLEDRGVAQYDANMLVTASGAQPITWTDSGPST